MKTISIIEALENNNNNDIEELNIFGRDFNKEPLEVDFRDLLKFPNLKKLNIEDCLISQKEIEILLQLKQLEELSFYSCDFEIEKLNNIDQLNIKSLSIRNSYDFPIEKLDHKVYQKLVLSHMKLKDIMIIVNELYLYDMEIDYETLKNWEIKQLIIDEEEYKKNEKFYENCRYEVDVLDENHEFKIKVGKKYE